MRKSAHITLTNANARETAKMKPPRLRPIGGSHSQSPSHDSARNAPITVSSMASGGHSPSQSSTHLARVSAPSRWALAAWGVGRRAGETGSGVWFVKRFSGTCTRTTRLRSSSPSSLLFEHDLFPNPGGAVRGPGSAASQHGSTNGPYCHARKAQMRLFARLHNLL